MVAICKNAHITNRATQNIFTRHHLADMNVRFFLAFLKISKRDKKKWIKQRMNYLSLHSEL